MKLIDILARELKEWPEGAEHVDQSAVDREVYTYDTNMRLGYTGIFLSQIADNPDAEVSRSQWQAAVDALKTGEEFVPFDFSGPVLDYGSREWTGEGRPPVGTELEAGFACEMFENWHKGVCVAVGEDPEGREEFCVVKFGNKIAMYRDEGRRMRPIRTPEQIAAEVREESIKDLMQLDDIYYEQAAAIYDAGYRKVSP